MLRIRQFHHQFSLVTIVLLMAQPSWLPRVVAEGEESITEMILAYGRSFESFVDERRYLCLQRTEMRGFYFAQNEPCQLTFFGSKAKEITEHDSETVCNDTTKQIGEPFLYWSRNASESGDDGNASEGAVVNGKQLVKVDAENEEKELSVESLLVHFWPDSCLGIRPRCFSLGNEKINSKLLRLQGEGRFPPFPDLASHILVNCTSDSQKAFERKSPADDELVKAFDSVESVLSNVVLTILLITFTFAALGCFCCCCCLTTKKRQPQSLQQTPLSNQPPQKPLYNQDGVNPDAVNAIQLDGEGFVDDRLHRQGLRQRRPL